MSQESPVDTEYECIILHMVDNGPQRGMVLVDVESAKKRRSSRGTSFKALRKL